MDWLNIIQLGENQTTEFKLSFNKQTIETIVAFANYKGGRVFIGVSDKKEILGTEISVESIQNWQNEIKLKTEPSIFPDIELLMYRNKKIVMISVSEYPVKPVSMQGRFFIRKNNSNHLLSANEINEVYLKSVQTSWDSYPYADAALSDLDDRKIKNFIQRVNEGGRFKLAASPFECLEKLRLIKNNIPTNAAMLLFSKEELLYNVHIGRFKTQSLIIDDKMVRGSLYDTVENTMTFIISHLKVAFEITGETSQRSEIFEYPLGAIRELVLNAIVHRDYTSPTDIQIRIFDNKITIFNPGRLYGDLTIADLKTDNYQAQSRNKLIAEAFYLTKDIEKYGSGYRRIREMIAEYPTMYFNFEENSGGYLVTLGYSNQKRGIKHTSFKENVTENVVENVIENVVENVIENVVENVVENVIENVIENVTENVTENVIENRLKLILNLIQKNPQITTIAMSKQLNITRMTLHRDLEKLRAGGKLKRIGPAKGGYWQIITKNNK